jgi:hypothetical protein
METSLLHMPTAIMHFSWQVPTRFFSSSNGTHLLSTIRGRPRSASCPHCAAFPMHVRPALSQHASDVHPLGPSPFTCTTVAVITPHGSFLSLRISSIPSPLSTGMLTNHFLDVITHSRGHVRAPLSIFSPPTLSRPNMLRLCACR